MAMIQTITEIEYPETDGMSMGETDLHRYWMGRIYDLLARRYSGRRAYVGSNLVVYFEKGEPSRFVVPDVFVALDCEPGTRRTFKIWEEGRAPNVAVEVTSLSTRHQDSVHKPQLYAGIGIPEYFLYDATQEYLSEPLQGYRLHSGRYERIEPDTDGGIESVELGIVFSLDDDTLILRDRQTGEALLTHVEAAEGRARQDAAERAAAQRAQQAAEERARRAEEELRELRKALEQRSGNNGNE